MPTECPYFSVGSYDFDAGIMITASHNPKEYNGFKMAKRVGNNIEMIRGLDLLLIIKSEDFKKIDQPEIKKVDIWQDYLNHILSFVDLSEIVPLKIIVDASNGVASQAILEIQDKLPAEILPLNFEPNGNFPNHVQNPFVKGSEDQIENEIKKQKELTKFIFLH